MITHTPRKMARRGGADVGKEWEQARGWESDLERRSRGKASFSPLQYKSGGRPLHFLLERTAEQAK
jgi:hypothetical protein